MSDDLPDVCIEIQRSTISNTLPSDEQFKLWVCKALSGRRDHAELVIRIVDSEEAQQFNLQYRNKDYATNVLSFPGELPAGVPEDVAGFGLGDLLMCAPVVSAEAKQQHKVECDHWAHLTVHGVLHLLGYDHEAEPEALVMEALEIEILNGFGVSDPYHDH